MKLNQLKSNPNNPRLIKDDKFKKLVTSLSEFPEMMEKRPMVCVTDTDGKLYPLGGNMRLKALQELKYKNKKASTDASIKAALFLPLKLLLHSF